MPVARLRPDRSPRSRRGPSTHTTSRRCRAACWVAPRPRRVDRSAAAPRRSASILRALPTIPRSVARGWIRSARTSARGDGLRSPARRSLLGRHDVPVPCERVDPGRVGAGSEFAFCVDDRVQLHRDPGVEVRPLAICAEDLNVQPEVPMGVRVEGAGSAVPQLDDLDPGNGSTEDAVVSAARVELALPGQQNAVA